jgi:uncharacterized protein YndB with AHSA1/START domain
MIWRIGSLRHATPANTNEPAAGARTRVTRRIRASRAAVYAAFLDADALAAWLAPASMTGEMHVFEPRTGGAIRMTLRYRDPGEAKGKTSANADTLCGRFAELVPNEKIVWVVTFESADPASAGEMTMIVTLADTPDGTEIAVTCENIPRGISPEDNAMGCRSSLQNLANRLEPKD